MEATFIFMIILKSLPEIIYKTRIKLLSWFPRIATAEYYAIKFLTLNLLLMKD